MKRTLSLISILTLIAIGSASAKERPKIGLVLGGGGAKAGTQIGVLKVMEELRIPVDFVVGTSMGSFIGMLYATGYPLEEIEKVLTTTDWNPVFLGEIDRRDRPMRRKQEDIQFMMRKKLGIKDGKLIMGTGIAETQNLRTLIRELTLHVATIKDFNELPLPYRAVAVDLANGSEVVLDHGELPDCVRSSMSLPGIFPPVIIDGKFLVDGGPANNLPISVAKAAGMDVVIAVDVGADYYKPGEITSFVEVIDQLTTFLTRGGTLEAYKLAGPKDVVLRPDITGLSTESYEKIADGFPRGETVARGAIEKLKTYSVSEEEYAAFRAKRERPRRDPPVIDSVRIEGESKFSDRVIQDALKVKTGKPLDAEEMRERVAKLYAFGEFSEVYYDLESRDGKTELVARVKDISAYDSYLRFGLRLYMDLEGNATFGAGFSHDYTRLNKLGGEWHNELEIGDSIRFGTEFYQPFEERLRYFILPKATFERRLVSAYDNNQLLASQYLDSSIDLTFAVGRHFSNVATLYAGFTESFGNFDNRLGTAVTDDKYDTGSYFVRLRIDTLDNTNIPHTGMFGSFEWEQAPSGIGSDYTYQKLGGKWLGFLPVGTKDTFNLSLEADTHFGDPLPPQEQFTLGGMARLTGFEREELAGQYLIFSRLMYYHRLGAKRLPIKSIPTYVGLTAEVGNTWDKAADVNFDSMVIAGGGFLMMDTFIGPIMVGGGYNTDDQGSVYLAVGRWY